MFISKSFVVSGLTVQSLIHFELCNFCVWCKRVWSSFFFIFPFIYLFFSVAIHFSHCYVLGFCLLKQSVINTDSTLPHGFSLDF